MWNPTDHYGSKHLLRSHKSTPKSSPATLSKEVRLNPYREHQLRSSSRMNMNNISWKTSHFLLRWLNINQIKQNYTHKQYKLRLKKHWNMNISCQQLITVCVKPPTTAHLCSSGRFLCGPFVSSCGTWAVKENVVLPGQHLNGS